MLHVDGLTDELTDMTNAPKTVLICDAVVQNKSSAGGVFKVQQDCLIAKRQIIEE